MLVAVLCKEDSFCEWYAMFDANENMESVIRKLRLYCDE